MRMVVDVLGVRKIERDFIGFANRAVNARPGLELVADALMETISLNFESQGRRGGGSWKQLQPSTIRSKMRAGQDVRILFATYALYDSLTHYGDENQDLTITDGEIKLSSKLPYAARQNRTRPFVRFLPTDTRTYSQIMSDYLTESFR